MPGANAFKELNDVGLFTEIISYLTTIRSLNCALAQRKVNKQTLRIQNTIKEWQINNFEEKKIDEMLRASQLKLIHTKSLFIYHLYYSWIEATEQMSEALQISFQFKPKQIHCLFYQMHKWYFLSLNTFNCIIIAYFSWDCAFIFLCNPGIYFERTLAKLASFIIQLFSIWWSWTVITINDFVAHLCGLATNIL